MVDGQSHFLKKQIYLLWITFVSEIGEWKSALFSLYYKKQVKQWVLLALTRSNSRKDT